MSECMIAMVPVCVRTYNSAKLSGIMPFGLIPPSTQRRKEHFSFLCIYIYIYLLVKKKEKYTIKYTPVSFRMQVE